MTGGNRRGGKTGQRDSREPRIGRRTNRVAAFRSSVWRVVHQILGSDVLWSGVLIALFVLTVGVQRCGNEYEKFEVGQIAVVDIKAIDDFEFVDVLRTDEARQQARNQVLEIYDYDKGRGVQLARRLSQLFEKGRQAIQGPTSEMARASGFCVTRSVAAIIRFAGARMNELIHFAGLNAAR